MTETASGHYQGERGEAYFAYQNQGGLQRGRINARKFAPHVSPTDAVLDFGCGNGSLLYHLDCHHRIGVEINPSARIEAEALGIEVYAELRHVEAHSIDLAISNHALEHVLCPLDILKQLRTKLVNGGRIVLCLPIDDWRTEPEANVQDMNHHLYTWTPLALA